MKIPVLVPAIACFFLLLFISGCSMPQPSPPPMPVNSLADAHNALGFKMLHGLVKTDSGKNVFISPTSISLALAMAYDGADGQTKDAMAKTLEFQKFSQNDIDDGSQHLMQSLSSRQDTELSVANSMWLNNDLQLNADYQSNMEKYFSARVSTLDFSLPASADTINGWVSVKTHGKIGGIVDPPLTGMEAILVNAVYFKGNWETPFDKSKTKDGVFTAGDGKQSQVPMMRQSGEYSYLENDGFQAIRLPYSRNSSLSMYVFLPKASVLSNPKIEDFAQKIDSAQWSQWLSEFGRKQGTIVLPRFKTEYSASLNDALKNSGMGVAFSPEANFGRMSPTPLKIDEVLHKTFVQTDEEGTEAAAVTAIVMVGSAMPGPHEEPFYMEVNRPFFFAIYDEQTGSILFMGTMNSV